MSLPINLVSVQFCPIYKDPEATRQKANKLLSNITQADILVLPEMAFPGYSFIDSTDISPFLEEPNDQYPTFQWCRAQATRLNSYVFCGYPEKTPEANYNAMMVLDPQGNLVTNYRKRFLYYVDKTWASEGDKFQQITLQINNAPVVAGLGICMDINPYEFTAPFTAFELANFWLDNNCDICVFCTNWTHSENGTEQELLSYWVTRMSPLLINDPPKRRFFVAADRIGEEEGIGYSGTSCVLELTPELQLLRYLDRMTEGVIECSINL